MARGGAKELGVWLNDTRIATLVSERGTIRCQYAEEAIETWPANTPLISCSLPISARTQNALPFCKGLLPEGRALEALAARAGVAVNDTFELLARYGRDVAGALIISADEPQERRFGVEPYSTETLATAVEDLEEYPLGAHDDSELSLAGLQDKLLLVEIAPGQWGRPLRGRPSTHILKVEHRSYTGLIPAEATCLALARAVGLTSIETQLESINDIPCLIVSRFDRDVRGEDVQRVHQEDLLQAKGTDPDLANRRIKYVNAGGPGFGDLAQLLDTYAADAPAELEQLLAVATFTVVIGNADAHGKNLALLHPTPDTVTLAPLYDTVPTILWSRLRTRAAMPIGGREELPEVTADDLVSEAVSWPFPQKRAREVVEQMIERCIEAADQVEAQEPRVTNYVKARGRQLAAG